MAVKNMLENASAILILWESHPFLHGFKAYPSGTMTGYDDVKLSENFIKGEITKYLESNDLKVTCADIDLIFYTLFYLKQVNYSALSELEKV